MEAPPIWTKMINQQGEPINLRGLRRQTRCSSETQLHQLLPVLRLGVKPLSQPATERPNMTASCFLPCPERPPSTPSHGPWLPISPISCFIRLLPAKQLCGHRTWVWPMEAARRDLPEPSWTSFDADGSHMFTRLDRYSVPPTIFRPSQVNLLLRSLNTNYGYGKHDQRWPLPGCWVWKKGIEMDWVASRCRDPCLELLWNCWRPCVFVG